jgi:hypothetical protein
MVTSLNPSTQEVAAYPIASSFSHPSQADLSTYWLPLEPLAQQWATFGREAMTCPAFGAVGMAFTALSWEAAALRQTIRASQAAPEGQQPPSEGMPLPIHLSSQDVTRTLEDLAEARQCWQSAVSWLEQLAHHEPLEPAQRESAQQCLEHATAQVQRLWALMGEVQETRMVPSLDWGRRMAS